VFQAQDSLRLSDGWLEVASFCRTEEAPHGSPIASRSRHAPPRKKIGAAKFFKNLWDMCKSTHDVDHQALVMSQDTRARQNEFFASKNYPCPTPGLEMNPVPYVNYVMPPIDDEMFYGYPMPSSQGCLHPPRTRVVGEDEINEE
jgi:hypothetical protein